MILKRKTDLTQIKSKDKIKQTKEVKQSKKPKKQKEPSEKNKVPSSKKPNKAMHMDRQQHYHQFEQNENQNRSNLQLNYIPLPHKMKINKQVDEYHQIDLLPMRRSASTGGIKLVRHIRKSLSPALSKQAKDKSDIKHKYSSKPTSRSEKQKTFTALQKTKSVAVIKKHVEVLNEKPKITRKKSQKMIKNQSLRQKTDNSQKNHEANQREQKKERCSNKMKNGKQLKSKQLSRTTSKAKLKLAKPKESKKNQVVFSDVSFHDSSPIYSAIVPRQNFYVKMQKNEENRVVNACVTIQRHMRGYLTRKYIEQSKFMVYCAIKIQKVWRGYSCRKKMKKNGLGKKNLSIENSLITIKDFSEEHKQEKLKNKSFRFNFQSDTKKKEERQDAQSQKKQIQQKEKYIHILQSLLLEDGLQQKFKQKIRTTLGHQKYVQKKIQAEIISQKSFNSPRQLRSPKNNVVMNSPSSWSKSKQYSEHLQNVCMSPRRNEVSEIISRRVSSPLQTKQIAHEGSGRRASKNTEQKQDQQIEVKPIQASMQFIQQMQLRIVDYLRDYNLIPVFLQICKRCQNFRTYLIMEQWNKTKQYNEQEINFLHPQICPDIFPISFRQEVIANNKICLEDNNYIESLWLSNGVQRFVYQSYIKFIFDCIGEAIFENYKLEVITRRSKGRICYYEGHELFTNVITNGLTLMQSWSQYMCGSEIPVPEDDPNYKLYCDKNRDRIQLMIKEDIREQKFSESGCFTFWLQLALTHQILQTLVAELWNQIIF